MDAAIRTAETELEKQFMRWQAAGHTVIFERGTFRHKVHKKDFPPDKVIMRNGIPFVTSVGHTLTIGDVFPERADLCLDLDGNVVSQDEFTRRYKEFLRWFPWNESVELDAEPIPGVETWLSETYDTFSDSGGFVEIGYDANKKPETVRTHLYDPIKDELVEIIKSQATTQEAIQFLLEQLKGQKDQKKG